MHAVEIRDVRKIYRRYGRRKSFGTLKSALLSGSVLKNLRPDSAFHALDGVSLDVRQGSTLGIIGRNGSGKSSLLKLIAGIGKPSSGTIHVSGRVSALIELGAGFHPEISGRENVFINGMMLGLSKAEVARRFDEIVAFAELGDFIDEPVKTYSSGMYMRLGFAVAINVDPDVLLVDEVLAVGDEAFTHKCLEKFAEFRRRGKTIVLVTHTLDLITRLCDEALWLDAGRVRGHGNPKRVVDAYLTEVAGTDDHAVSAAAQPPAASGASARPTVARGAGVRRRRSSSTSSSCAPTDSRSTSSSLGSRCGFAWACAPHGPCTTSSSASGSSPPTACVASAPTRRSKAACRASGQAAVPSPWISTASISSPAPTSSTSPCTARTACRTTITACSIRSAWPRR